ncbi:hypothetical protein J2755_001768 [Methanohalophilus levihalophilus]|uniref:hypothetical protein n=1 Tax=Methanohalophilus levihalophilus TaxID=1431282 RepID=UPI001AE8B62E|nr:hypothetical protein [Methanohalophilus levihalophilus]MBP2030820.1 hypothetical protein [Methanohalophilus levihalophilus]
MNNYELIQHEPIKEEISICPACGHGKDPDKELCVYCYTRSTIGASKFLVFKIMYESGNKYRTRQEIHTLVNEWRKENGKPEVKLGAVYNILNRYAPPNGYKDKSKRYRRRNPKMLVKDVKKKGVNKPIKKYKLSAGLVKRLKYFENNWLNGFHLNETIKKKFCSQTNNRIRIQGIKRKIAAGEYEPYKYMVLPSIVY